MRCRQTLVLSGLVAAAGLLASPAGAAVQVTIETDLAPPGGSGFYDPTPQFSSGASSLDLLEGLLPTASTGVFDYDNTDGLSALTEGSIETLYPDSAYSITRPYATAGAGHSATYSLGGRFDIGSIVVFGGWVDGGRDQQHYDVLTSTDGGVTFNVLETVDHDVGILGVDIWPVTHRVEFFDDALPNLAADVTHVRFDFLPVENGYTGYLEIDVFGTAPPLPIDPSGNGVIDLEDFAIISDHFLQVPSAAGRDGDVNFDNFVDEADFAAWKIAYGEATTAAGWGVPEPPACLLLGIAAWGFVVANRRRRI